MNHPTSQMLLGAGPSCRRLAAIAGVACALIVSAAFAQPIAATAPRSTRRDAGDLAAATGSFRAYVRTLGTAGFRSFTLTSTAAGIYGAVSYNTGVSEGVLRIARYRDGIWNSVTSVPLQGSSSGQANTQIRAQRLTGSIFPEFGVRTQLGDSYGYSEVTAAGGHWRQLEFLDAPFRADTVVGHFLNDTVSGKLLTITWSDCDPACYNGQHHTTSFLYGRRSHQLVAVG